MNLKKNTHISITDLDRIYNQTRCFLRKKILEKYKKLEYDNPNYWDTNWIFSFLKRFKLSEDQKRSIFYRLKIPYK